MNKKQIGTQIESLRKKQKISRYKVVKDTGLPFSVIKSIDEAKSNYTIDTLIKYTDSINLKIEIKPKNK